MKTLIITNEYPPRASGVGASVYNLAAHLPSSETFVWVPTMPEGEAFDKRNAWRVFRSKKMWSFLSQNWQMYRQLSKIMQTEKMERVMVFNVILLGKIALKLHQKFHTPFLLCLNNTNWEYFSARPNRMKKFALLAQAADRVLVESKFLQHKVLSRLENLINVDVFYPRPGDNFLESVAPERLNVLRAQLALNGKKVLVTAARMVEGKGYPLLVRILPQILAEVPNLVWLIIGDGPKRPMIFDLIKKNNLQNVVRFLGGVDYFSLPEYYQLGDVFVALQHSDEGHAPDLPVSLLEAAACALPVVTTADGGADELVEHARTGLIVDIHQENNVIKSLVDLLKNEKYARELGMAGHERVLN